MALTLSNRGIPMATANRKTKEGIGSEVDRERDDDLLSCGIVMPLSLIEGCDPNHWSDVQSIIREAVESLDAPRFKAEMVSQADYVGLIHKRIVSNLYRNEIVVCDVSCRNPNVMFELGMRLAFDKPVVIIKDDKTNYSFDTGPIEHLEYPRDLRYGVMQAFKVALAEKVKSTYLRHKDDPEAASYLKSFGPIQVATLETKEVGMPDFLLTQMEGIRAELRFVVNQMMDRGDVSLRRIKRLPPWESFNANHIAGTVTEERVIKAREILAEKRKSSPLSVFTTDQLHIILKSQFPDVDERELEFLAREAVRVAQ